MVQGREVRVRLGFLTQRKMEYFFLVEELLYCGTMVCIRLALFSLAIISVFLGHVAPSNAQETGILSVTTTPVSGAIYVDYVFMGTRFWSGNLNAGFHVVSFGDVDGYIAPSPQTITVVPNQTYYIIGAYRRLLSLKK
jgi:hypothetical protein